MLTFNPASVADATALMERGVRQSDWRECLKATGGGMGVALRLAVATSSLAVAARIEGRILALFGVAADPAGQGVVWLTAHAEAEAPGLAVPLARASRHFVDRWLRHFKYLHNVVDPTHNVSLRWLKWLGFYIDRENPVRGPLGHELYRFWRT